MGNDRVGRLETQGKEKTTSHRSSESGGKEGTMIKDKTGRAAGGIREFKDITGSDFPFHCADSPISLDGSFILPVVQD